MNNEKKIISVLDELVLLLVGTGEGNWLGALKTIRGRFVSADNVEDFKVAQDEILRIFGGMGSFSDLVLYKNGQVLIKETQTLHSLRKELFELVSDR